MPEERSEHLSADEENLRRLMDAVHVPHHLRFRDTFNVQTEQEELEIPWWPSLTEVSAEVVRLWWAGHHGQQEGVFTFTRYDPSTSATSIFRASFDQAHHGFFLRWSLVTRFDVRHQYSRDPRGLLDTLLAVNLWLSQAYGFAEMVDAPWTPSSLLRDSTEQLWDVLGQNPPGGQAAYLDLRSAVHPGRARFLFHRRNATT